MLRKDDLQNGFFIYQDPDYFCFGIDAVLLAHFPEIRDGDRVLDMGCGFGPVPLIMRGCLPEGADVRMTGLEIQDYVAETAERSVRENGLSDEIGIVKGDIREAARIFGAASFSLVTCNPPYMAVKDGLVGENRSRAVARTEVCCTLRDVICQAARLLRPKGRFAMIHRPFRLPEMLSLMRDCRLEPKRLRMIHPRAGAEASMVLIEAVRGGRPYLIAEPPLMIYGPDGTYTQEVLDIYAGRRRS